MPKKPPRYRFPKAQTEALSERGKKTHTVNIRSADGMTPEELQAKLDSGAWKPIDENEKVDLSKHNKFVTVRKDQLVVPKLDFRRDGVMATIPEGAHPRLLDAITAETGGKSLLSNRLRQMLHRSHHFKLGFKASEYLLALTVDDVLVQDIQPFAPHPFDLYTVSLWIGTEDGGVAEALLIVDCETAGGPTASLLFIPWGTDRPFIGSGSSTRVSFDDLESDPQARLGWLLCDAFRLLMSRPVGRTIIRGGPPRTAVRKGKRVHFYSASEIKIDLDAVKQDRVVGGNGFGKMMPVYQYRAHLCHSGGQRGCEHEWISIGGIMTEAGQWIPDNQNPRSNPFWECYHCGRHRWHRKAGTRGSAEVGYVRQTYKITKGEDDDDEM